ncbi:50S ribosomal protein L25 [Candidatus Nasuia deltocephalinicola]|uniref:50S ribosomal protein L25 n=1 Tax=Candidatus Nasuia deltocephalincola TaxID=1160784 RepID=UPI00216ADFAB|nr:50S ribosomal protein L25 [Candidatus Nasuia deltocephalinicola]
MMMEILIVNLYKKNNNKDKIKGIIYKNNFKNLKIEFKKKNKYYEKLKKNNILKIIIINNKFKVLIKDIQKHPYKKEIIHIDFLIND